MTTAREILTDVVKAVLASQAIGVVLMVLVDVREF